MTNGRHRSSAKRVTAFRVIVVLVAGTAIVLAAVLIGKSHGSATAQRSPGHAHRTTAPPPSPASPTDASTPTKPPKSPQGSSSNTGKKVPEPKIVQKFIPFPAKRKKEMAAYSQEHYGMNTYKLTDPKVIVEHYTGSSTFQSAYDTFASNAKNLGELPGVCAHFIVDTDGTIYQLVPLNIMCRHTVGLNYTAIGIEHVGTSDQQILRNPKQLDASLHLTLWLMQKYGIDLGNVIGHNESLTSKYHMENVKSWQCQTHSDWNHPDMQVYRKDLERLNRRYDVPLGPPIQPQPSNC